MDGDVVGFGIHAADAFAAPGGGDDVFEQHFGDGVGRVEMVVEVGGGVAEVLIVFLGRMKMAATPGNLFGPLGTSAGVIYMIRLD